MNKLAVITLVLIIVFTGAIWADGGASENSVSWDAGQPSSQTNKITGSGTYATKTGWTATSVVLTALPTGGGQGYSGSGNPSGGKWGPITLNNVATGQYTVYATILFSDGGTGRETVNSPVSQISVP